MLKILVLCTILVFSVGALRQPVYTTIKKNESEQHVIKIQAPDDVDLDAICLYYVTGRKINCYSATPGAILEVVANLIPGRPIYAIATDRAGNRSVHSNLGYPVN